APGKSQFPICARGGFELLESRNQSHVIFSRMFESRDIKKKWALQIVTLRGFLLRFVAGAGKEPFMIQPIMNDGNPLARKPKKLCDVPSRIFADGNASILPPRQPPHDDAAIEHPFPFIF